LIDYFPPPPSPANLSEFEKQCRDWESKISAVHGFLDNLQNNVLKSSSHLLDLLACSSLNIKRIQLEALELSSSLTSILHAQKFVEDPSSRTGKLLIAADTNS